MTKQTIKQVILEKKADLEKMTKGKLREFAIINDWYYGHSWGRFKKALLEIGVDYDAMS